MCGVAFQDAAGCDRLFCIGYSCSANTYSQDKLLVPALYDEGPDHGIAARVNGG